MNERLHEIIELTQKLNKLKEEYVIQCMRIDKNTSYSKEMTELNKYIVMQTMLPRIKLL